MECSSNCHAEGRAGSFDGERHLAPGSCVLSSPTVLCDPDALAAVRTWLLTGRPPRGPSPKAIVAAAAAQGLCSLLYARAARAGDELPTTLAEPLRHLHHVAMARAERQLQTVRQAAALLAEQGLRALPLKGAAVAEWLYDSPGERSMDDVDLLALDDFGRSRRALEQAGFVEQERADHARSYLAPSGVLLELHHSVTSCPGLFPVDREGLWLRSSRPPATERPSAEDVLIQLGLHTSFQHGLAIRLIQYVDLRRLLERSPPETSRVLELARASHASAALALALEAAALVVAAPVPSDLREALRPALPAGLRSWLEGCTPGQLVDPDRPPLVRLRWALSQGRRRALWVGTLDGCEPGGERTGLRRARHVAARVWTLARRCWAAL